MNLKVLFLLLIYYGVISLFFLSSGSVFADAGFNETASGEFNESISEGELDSGGLFGTGISFGRYVGFVLIGIGLPEDTPSWFSVIFAVWQSIVTMLAIGWLIGSIWDG